MVQDDDTQLSPEASLALIAQQQQVAQQRLDVDPVVFLAPWGVAWLIGYGLLFLRFGPDERVFWSMPRFVPFAVLYGLLVAAGILSGIGIARATRGIAGDSADRGAMYCLAWFVAFAGYAVLGPRFEAFMPDDQFGLLMSSLPIFISGILYMGGGAVWLDRRQFALGVWLVVVNVAGVLAGPGWHSLIVSLLGGGMLLAAAAYHRLRTRSPRRPMVPAGGTAQALR